MLMLTIIMLCLSADHAEIECNMYNSRDESDTDLSAIVKGSSYIPVAL